MYPMGVATNNATWQTDNADQRMECFPLSKWPHHVVMPVNFEAIVAKVWRSFCKGCAYSLKVRLVVVEDIHTDRQYLHIYAKTHQDLKECKSAVIICIIDELVNIT